MTNLSDYSEKLLLDWLMTNGAVTRPTAWYLALFTTAPSDAGGGTEVVGNGYARQAIAFDAAATPGGTTQNSGIVSFTAAGGNWGSITHVGIFTALTAGNLLWHGPLTAVRTINDTDGLNFAVGIVAPSLA